MTPERQVFLTDGLVGIGPATVGVLTFGPEAGWLALPVALAVAALIAGVNYYDEHVGFERTLGEGVVSVGAVVAPFLVSLGLFYLGSPLAVSVSLGGFVGLIRIAATGYWCDRPPSGGRSRTDSQQSV